MPSPLFPTESITVGGDDWDASPPADVAWLSL